MKKNKLLIAAVIATLLCLSSCKKEENGKVLFKATIESTARQSKTDIANDGTMTWHSGDRIVVFYGTSATNMTGQSLLSTTSTGRTAEFTLALGDEPTGGHYYAVYPANIAGMIYHNRINLPETQEYHAAEGDKVQFEAPMYAYSNDDQLAFKNLCGVVRITLTAPKTISRIVISANEPLCGQFTVNWNGGEPTLAAISTEGTEVEFTCGSGVDCTNGADFYLYLPVNETGYTGMEFAFYATDGSRCSKTLKSDQRYVVGRNTLNPLVFGNMTFCPVGSKGGLFSVSEGHQVRFSLDRVETPIYINRLTGAGTLLHVKTQADKNNGVADHQPVSIGGGDFSGNIAHDSNGGDWELVKVGDGMLTLTGSDPMDPESWTKSKQPVFQKTNQVVGPGHASFTTSPDGLRHYMVYHANDQRGTGWAGRKMWIQEFTVDSKNRPNFGKPGAAGTLQSVPVNWE